MSCGKSLTKEESVGRVQNGGCIPAMTYECGPCAQESDARAMARAYKEKYFCARCDERFKRPFFRNRKRLLTGARWGIQSNSYCLACFEVEKANLPKEDDSNDIWGGATDFEDKSHW